MSYKNLIFSTFLILTSLFGFSQSPENELQKADSLFQKKLYTQSLETYNKLYNDNFYSLSMLLKMGYIYEGLEDYPKAAFFLSKANKIAPDEALELKVLSLAINHNLEGYEASDEEIITAFLASFIEIGRYILIIIMLATLIWYILKNKFSSLIAFSIVSLFWVLTFFTDTSNRAAVIWHPNTYAMQQDAAASKVVNILPAGNRYLIVEKGKHWVQLKSGETSFYVKKENLKFI